MKKLIYQLKKLLYLSIPWKLINGGAGGRGWKKIEKLISPPPSLYYAPNSTAWAASVGLHAQGFFVNLHVLRKHRFLPRKLCNHSELKSIWQYTKILIRILAYWLCYILNVTVVCWISAIYFYLCKTCLFIPMTESIRIFLYK